MLRSTIATLAFALAATTGALAQSAQKDKADYDMSPFEMKEVPIAVATDKSSGKKFNVVKLPSGKMMAVIPMDKLGSTSPFSDDSEMMYSGHTGTSK